MQHSGEHTASPGIMVAEGSYLRFQGNVYDTGQGEEYTPLDLNPLE